METLNTQPNLAQIQNANKKPPHQLNLYKGSHAEQPTNSEENKQSQQQQQSASQYQYKPPLQKKKNQKQNSHQQKESVDQISGLIIESKEYQSKNQNEEDQNYQSPSSAGISGSKQTQFLKKKQVSTKPFQSRKAQQPQVQGQPSASLTPEGQQSQHQQTFQQASGSYQADEKDAQQGSDPENEEEKQPSYKPFKKTLNNTQNLQNSDQSPTLKTNFETKTVVYLQKDELSPLPNPEKAFKSAMNDLKIDDWQK